MIHYLVDGDIAMQAITAAFPANTWNESLALYLEDKLANGWELVGQVKPYYPGNEMPANTIFRAVGRNS